MHPDPAPSSAGKVSLHLHACSTLRLRSAFAFACQRHGMLGRSRQIYIPCFHTECHQANSRPDRDQIFAFPHLVPSGTARLCHKQCSATSVHGTMWF